MIEKPVLDLDALERAFDQAEELPFVRMPTLRAVVDELRVCRKVMEAAREASNGATASYSHDPKYWVAITRQSLGRLRIALAALDERP